MLNPVIVFRDRRTEPTLIASFCIWSQLGRCLSSKLVHSSTVNGSTMSGFVVIADHQPIRFAIADNALSPTAAHAQVLVAHRRSVFDLQFAHGSSFLIRTCRRLMTGEQTAAGFFGALPFEFPRLTPGAGLEPASPLGQAKYPLTYTTGLFLVLNEILVGEEAKAGEQTETEHEASWATRRLELCAQGRIRTCVSRLTGEVTALLHHRLNYSCKRRTPS